MFSLGIAVGKQTHTVVKPTRGKKVKTIPVPNSFKGLMMALAMLKRVKGERSVVFFGNHRWASPMAYALAANQVACFYFSLKQGRGGRGPVGNLTKLLVTMMQMNARAREFFRVGKQTPEAEALPTTYRLAEEYLAATNSVRETKHRLLDCLAILFPEVVKAKTTSKRSRDGKSTDLPVPYPQPLDLFTKKMREVLENPDPFSLADHESVPEEVRILAQNSLGRFVPQETREATMLNYHEQRQNYDDFLELKSRKMEELREAVGNHPLIEHFGGGDLIYVVVAMLAWRDWPRWRELRHFCGLDVSRVDAKGKPRISRVRPHTRQYLYLLATRTKQGKEVTAGVKKRVKRIERLLKYLRNHSLKGPEVQIREVDVA